MVGRLAALAPYAAHFDRDPQAVLDDLDALAGIVSRWQRVQNLVSRETLPDLWRRHILDSLQLLPLLPTQQEITVLDLGSGGGFPSLPLAIALKGTSARLHLVESNGRKCAFLKAATRELALPVVVHQARIEAVSSLGPVDVITARALAPLPLLFVYLHRFWGETTRALLHKGREYGEEMKQADSAWVANVLIHRSRVDRAGVILEIKALAPRLGH